MREPDEDLHALTARYFDGELADDDVARALDHLTTCAACQRDLGDQVGLAVALGLTAADVAPAPAPVIPIAAARCRTRRLRIDGECRSRSGLAFWRTVTLDSPI